MKKVTDIFTFHGNHVQLTGGAGGAAGGGV